MNETEWKKEWRKALSDLTLGISKKRTKILEEFIRVYVSAEYLKKIALASRSRGFTLQSSRMV